MWEDLKSSDKKRYQTLITNFASLSQAFSQKADTDDGDLEQVAPIVNSKFQETVFQRAFNAVAEDIANTSYDASLVLDDKHKYLVGIKSFGLSSGDQKVAQFKKDSQKWTEILQKIQFHASISNSKEEADEKNKASYETLARYISHLRNQRIASSKAQIKGFQSEDVSVESVYHVLMPTRKGQDPKIHVGETSYLPIDIEQLQILGATNLNNPTNFRFTDGNHVYKYTAADSQLHMTFNNQDIIVETWDVSYVEDPFYLFEHLHELSGGKEEQIVEQTVSWMIPNAKHEVEESSGYNAFDGGSKLAKADREKRIASIETKYTSLLAEDELKKVSDYLKEILLISWKKTEDMKSLRSELMTYLMDTVQNIELINDIEHMIYRPISELYIPIPDAKHFHQTYPNFFGEAIGTFKENSNKLALPKEERIFTLRFLPSGDEIEAYINQDNGKAIQSTQKQGILGEWILRGVFQLKERERLTYERLVQLEINGVRLTKHKDSTVIGIEFIWIDEENPPADAIGWIAKQRESD
ncbi:hypothetical protein [Streptococcus saliviloxodontae]|uniref:Restriction endonuclease n=1 Tax=Streptococcus saliviloxodontae TaxID=1349416 RepID=A0ABS2PJK1_9STRE|nr:hypothetical protein [Streptococcus saliviloxodontae]MBM7635600.1 hypothetical protein [Streptococcus saliviloxodontae]